MAKKKRGPGRPPKKKNRKSQHTVPNGFWGQVGAVLLIVFALILMLGLFGIGGVFPTGLAGTISWLIGWAAFVLPILFVWQAIQIFRSESNQLSFAVWVATIIFITLIAGIFQLLLDDFTKLAVITEPLSGTGGGFLGWLVTVKVFGGALEPGVMALILSAFSLILLLFVLAIPPKSLIDGIRNFFSSGDGEESKNEKVARQAAELTSSKKLGELKINNPTKDEIINNNKQLKTKDTMAKRSLVGSSDEDWEFPSIDLLSKNSAPANPGNVEENAKIIQDTLNDYGVDVTPESVNVGPRVTQYTLSPARGTRFEDILKRERELRAALAVEKIRIEAPIPGKREVGVEIPNEAMANVSLYNMFSSKEWEESDGGLDFVVGRDTSNRAVVADLAEMPHLLIAGQTKAGKSVMINSLLCSLLFRNSPSDLKLILVDPKVVELSRYKDIPHLLTPIITDCSTNPTTTVSALKWAVDVMDSRYRELADAGATNIKEYNERMAKKEKAESDDGEVVANEKMPYIVIAVDEMADLMMAAGRDVEALIIRLAQKGRAAGVHLVLATQSPRKEVVTGLIKANIPATIAFAVKNHTESGIVLGANGAEKLLGKGDMLLQTTDSPAPKRIQGTLTTNGEVAKITHAVRLQRPPDYDPEIIKQHVQLNGKGGVMFESSDSFGEYDDAKRIVVETGKASTSFLQRRMKIGYSKAAGFLDQMEEEGIVGPQQGSRPREVLVSSIEE